MHPVGEIAGRMLRVRGFVQSEPRDGAPPAERTDAYLGYDAHNFFVVFVCFDGDPQQVRAHLTRRENLYGEDLVRIYLDTFEDRRRAYGFLANALGVQRDLIWTESQGQDSSFDTVWDSQGQRTAQGYVVRIAIPFKSIRFPGGDSQSWGIILQRYVPRLSETSSWPPISNTIEGMLTQEARITGLGRAVAESNFSVTPYGLMNSFKRLDLRDDVNPRYTSKHLGGTGGVDAKAVIRKSFVLDATFNPDFSQVESDEPQLTSNQRFATYFPEKRPFFLENSDFFLGPSFVGRHLHFYRHREAFVFTRNIEDPEYGVRLTGRAGPYSVGLLATDDRGPGETVADSDPDFLRRAYFAIGRVRRDFGDRATLGAFYTDREFGPQFNRIGGLDLRLRLGENWVLSAGADMSATIQRDDNGNPGYSSGPAYDFHLERSGRRVDYNLEYHDTAPGFVTNVGFFRRPDIRRIIQTFDYRFRPERSLLTSWGPHVNFGRSYDYGRLSLDEVYETGLDFDFRSQTYAHGYVGYLRETLRPQDYDTLAVNTSYREPYWGAGFDSNPTPLLGFHVSADGSRAINYNPPDGVAPFAADELNLSSGFTLRPLTPLVVDNSYLFDALRDPGSSSTVFTNHIIRSKWNYQFNRELSARLILQYNALLSDPGLSSLDRSKDLNADFLVTYLVHPGTALYAGYNSNFENIDPGLCRRLAFGECDPDGPGLLHGNRSLLNDGRSLFLKVSYEFRF